jgi:catechol 2,3-dioxygenase-like lactoylglutathione lyase family enzyme
MVRFLGTSPRLAIRNLEGALRFYEDILGFEAGDPWPEDDPSFVVMHRDDVVLQFALAQPGEPVGHVTIALNVDDARAVYLAVKDRVIIDWGPEVYWYGRREFSFRDPDGYPIIISEATNDPVEADRGQ